MRRLLSLLILATCLFVACGKSDVKDSVVKKGTPDDGRGFDTFLYNEKPAGTMRYNYAMSADADFLEMGQDTTDAHKLRGGKAFLFLQRDHTFLLFFNTYLRHKKDDGTFCRGTKGI